MVLSIFSQSRKSFIPFEHDFILRNQQSLKLAFLFSFVFIQAMKNQLSNVDEVQNSSEEEKELSSS